jgi:transcriptional regulator GlxA family with amidase domain
MLSVGFVVAPGFQMISLAALSVFEFANNVEGGPHYDVQAVSETGGPVRSSVGIPIETQPLVDQAFDTVIFSGALGPPETTPGLIAYARHAEQSSRRIASICTGAFTLAEAGILDGRKVTTHWFYARELQSRYPGIRVDDDRIFTTDGTVWTSAGASAGIDLALGMVEKDLGAEAARAVARKLVIYHRRAGGQSQHSTLLELDAKSDRIQTVLVYARENLKAPLGVEELADVAHLSPRQFSRAFHAETGQSPAKAVENLRVEAARLMMEQGRHSIDTIARETGFADRERMRQAFLRAFGRSPQAMRRDMRVEA